MSTDARIMTSLPAHPKTRKLIRRHGQAAAWNLVCLFLFARNSKPNGVLDGMTGEDIELAADWQGEDGQFVRTLLDVGFLDQLDDGYEIHDWAEHNPWAAGAEMRSEKSRWAALCMRHGKEEAARMMPEYANRKQRAGKNEPDAKTNEPVADSSSAPSPSPSPSPLPKQALDEPSHPEPTPPTTPALVTTRPPATGTEAGRACLLMREAGCATVNPGHPDLLDALAAGVTPEALADTVAEAIQAGKTKPFQWAIATARGRLEESGRRLAVPGHHRPKVVLGLADQVMQTYHDNQRRKLAHERND